MAWNVDFAIDDERKKHRLKYKLDKLIALIETLQFVVIELLVKEDIHMEARIIQESDINELEHRALGIDLSMEFDLNANAIYLNDVDE